MLWLMPSIHLTLFLSRIHSLFPAVLLNILDAHEKLRAELAAKYGFLDCVKGTTGSGQVHPIVQAARKVGAHARQVISNTRWRPVVLVVVVALMLVVLFAKDLPCQGRGRMPD
jgi:hypothetical protein